MSNSNRLYIGIGALSAVTAAALGLLVLIAVPAAQAAVVPCSTSGITACGCTITAAGFYPVLNNISSADGLTAMGDCIDIRHSDAVLDGGDFDADGAGSGVGVRILSGAVRATVQNFFEIDDWNIGVEDDANSANISNEDINDNVTANVFLKSANKTVVDDFDADDSTAGSCILLKNSNQNTFQDFDASGCVGGDGITATGSNNNSFSDFFTDVATGDGVFFKNSRRNALSLFESDANGGDGVAFTNSSNKNSVNGADFNFGFGISDNGLDGVFIDPSSNVKVDDSEADSNTGNGIEIVKGSKQNSVIFNGAFFNGGTDLVDGNPNCANGKNVWTNNFFGSSSDACIN
jgi:hypothetical protein